MKGLQRAAGTVRKTVEKVVVHPPYFYQYLPAGEASAAPPLGPLLGRYGVQIGPFCKQFNDQTSKIKPGTPIPTDVRINPDRSFTITCSNPPMQYFLKLAAGVKKGARGNEVAGKISLKHVYEIAKIKSEDPSMDGYSLEEVCRFVINVARTCGIEVVKSLDPAEYRAFLDERKNIVAEQDRQFEEIRQARLLRI